jgi:hypothetical protein
MSHDELAETTAQILLDTNAVLFQPDQPFFFRPGGPVRYLWIANT